MCFPPTDFNVDRYNDRKNRRVRNDADGYYVERPLDSHDRNYRNVGESRNDPHGRHNVRDSRGLDHYDFRQSREHPRDRYFRETDDGRDGRRFDGYRSCYECDIRHSERLDDRAARRSDRHVRQTDFNHRNYYCVHCDCHARLHGRQDRRYEREDRRAICDHRHFAYKVDHLACGVRRSHRDGYHSERAHRCHSTYNTDRKLPHVAYSHSSISGSDILSSDFESLTNSADHRRRGCRNIHNGYRSEGHINYEDYSDSDESYDFEKYYDNDYYAGDYDSESAYSRSRPQANERKRDEVQRKESPPKYGPRKENLHKEDQRKEIQNKEGLSQERLRFKFMSGLAELVLEKIDFEAYPEFQKNFYKEAPIVAERAADCVSQYRTEHNIIVCRGEAPNPVETFSEINLPDYVKKEIEHQRFNKPTPIQSQAWPIVLSGKNLVGIAQTGSGKTLAYLLPAIIHINNQPKLRKGEGPIALVLAPTRELAQQIQQVANRFGRSSGVRNSCIFGGIIRREQIAGLQQGTEILIATPGRLLDFLATKVVSLEHCTYVTIDEADRMLDMGFEPQIRKILTQVRPDKQVLMWSATWPKSVQRLAEDFLDDYVHINVGPLELAANHNILQKVEVCETAEKEPKLLALLDRIYNRPEYPGKILIFAQTKQRVERLTSKIAKHGYYCSAMHGDRSQMQRDLIIQKFRDGDINVVVATDVAARGLDVEGIQHVINYDYPASAEDYIHRIGRTGRSKAKGNSYTFFTAEDSRRCHDLISILREAHQQVSPELQNMAKYGDKKIRNSRNALRSAAEADKLRSRSCPRTSNRNIDRNESRFRGGPYYSTRQGTDNRAYPDVASRSCYQSRSGGGERYGYRSRYDCESRSTREPHDTYEQTSSTCEDWNDEPRSSDSLKLNVEQGSKLELNSTGEPCSNQNLPSVDAPKIEPHATVEAASKDEKNVSAQPNSCAELQTTSSTKPAASEEPRSSDEKNLNTEPRPNGGGDAKQKTHRNVVTGSNHEPHSSGGQGSRDEFRPRGGLGHNHDPRLRGGWRSSGFEVRRTDCWSIEGPPNSSQRNGYYPRGRGSRPIYEVRPSVGRYTNSQSYVGYSRYIYSSISSHSSYRGGPRFSGDRARRSELNGFESHNGLYNLSLRDRLN